MAESAGTSTDVQVIVKILNAHIFIKNNTNFFTEVQNPQLKLYILAPHCHSKARIGCQIPPGPFQYRSSVFLMQAITKKHLDIPNCTKKGHCIHLCLKIPFTWHTKPNYK